MQKSFQLYHDILHFFSNPELLSSLKLLPQRIIQDIYYVLDHGNLGQKNSIRKAFACCILDGKVLNHGQEEALNLLKASLGKEKLPSTIYYRLLLSLPRTTQTLAIRYILWAFDLKYYDAIFDVGEILLSGKNFPKDSDYYCKTMYSLLLNSLRWSDNKFISIVFHLLRHMVVYRDMIFDDCMEIFEYTMRSEYWSDNHTEMLQVLMIKNASLFKGDAMLEINRRLEIIDNEKLVENLHSSLPIVSKP